jgi:hypothetical protein
MSVSSSIRVAILGVRTFSVPAPPPPRETFIPAHGERMARGEEMQISPGFAKLSNTQLKKVQKLENDLGVILIARERLPAISELSGEELRSLKDMEKKMGLTLVAYRRE